MAFCGHALMLRAMPRSVCTEHDQQSCLLVCGESLLLWTEMPTGLRSCLSTFNELRGFAQAVHIWMSALKKDTATVHA